MKPLKRSAASSSAEGKADGGGGLKPVQVWATADTPMGTASGWVYYNAEGKRQFEAQMTRRVRKPGDAGPGVMQTFTVLFEDDETEGDNSTIKDSDDELADLEAAALAAFDTEQPCAAPVEKAIKTFVAKVPGVPPKAGVASLSEPRVKS